MCTPAHTHTQTHAQTQEAALPLSVRTTVEKWGNVSLRKNHTHKKKPSQGSYYQCDTHTLTPPTAAAAETRKSGQLTDFHSLRRLTDIRAVRANVNACFLNLFSPRFSH